MTAPILNIDPKKNMLGIDLWVDMTDTTCMQLAAVIPNTVSGAHEWRTQHVGKAGHVDSTICHMVNEALSNMHVGSYLCVTPSA